MIQILQPDNNNDINIDTSDTRTTSTVISSSVRPTFITRTYTLHILNDIR